MPYFGLFFAFFFLLGQATNEDVLHFSVFFTESSNRNINRTYAIINGTTTDKFSYRPQTIPGFHPRVQTVRPEVDVLWLYWEGNFTTGPRTSLGEVRVESSRPADVQASISDLERNAFYLLGNEPKLTFLNISCEKQENETSWGVVTVSGDYYGKMTEKFSFSFSFIKICNIKGVPLVDFSILLVCLLGIFALVFGISSSPLFASHSNSSELEVNPFYAFFFAIFASICFVFIYTLQGSTIYFISGVFAIMGWLSLSDFLTTILLFFRKIFGFLSPPQSLISIPVLGQYSAFDIFAAALSLWVVSLYYFQRYLVYSNLICFSLTIVPLRLPLIQSFGVSLFVLFLACLFDFVWLYVAPVYLNHTMMALLTMDLPIPFEFMVPWIVETPLPRCSRFCIMSVIVPGIILSYLHKFGRFKARSTYFYVGFLSFLIGVLSGSLHMLLVQRIFPFFFYICPLMAASVILTGVLFKDTKSLFTKLSSLEEKNKEESHGKNVAPEGTHTLHFDDEEEAKEAKTTELVPQKPLTLENTLEF